MSKLYPPYIEGTIPAFTGDELIVPFSMNRAVGKNQISGFLLKIKTVQNSLYIAELQTDNFDLSKMEAYFKLDESILKKLNHGQYYKLQLAYYEKKSNNINPGYFSTVGVIKYTCKPEIYIEGLKDIGTNNHIHGYLGVYRQDLNNGDVTEKVYSDRFVIFNMNNSIYYDSGEMLHNSTEDISIGESTKYFEILEDLPEKKSFYIQYIVKTNNGLICKSKQYKIMQRKTLETDFLGGIKATLNRDEGYVQITMVGENEDPKYSRPVTGIFLISRANVKDLNTWEPLHRFVLQSETPHRQLFKDCTFKHGNTYVYSLQQYNDNGLYSNRKLSKEIYADFEDSFIYDGERQLKIKFNPKVTSFKNTVLETKTDTIGGQHPFIFRNGKVKYKEFPISGLISYFMDEEQLFNNGEDFSFPKNLYRKKELNLPDIKNGKTTNLTSQNIYKETEFKLDVLEWLSNGETKLFRSPTEGNYLVRLMNVSLTPNDTVGRMLHTFNCNAYEIAECTHKNMLEYGVLDLPELQDVRMRWGTRPLYSYNNEGEIVYFSGEALQNFTSSNKKYKVNSILFADMKPGDYFYLNVPKDEEVSEEYKITIGATGSLYIDNIGDIFSVIIPDGANYQGTFTFSYEGVYPNKFSLVSDVTVEDVPLKIIIGNNNNIKTLIEDLKTKVYNYTKVKILKRPVYKIFINDDDNESYYWEKDFNDIKYNEKQEPIKIDVSQLDPYGIYKIHRQAHISNNENNHSPAPEGYHFNEDLYLKEHFDKLYPFTGDYLDGNSKEVFDSELYSTTFSLNGNTFDLEGSNPYTIKDIEIDSLILGKGLYFEAVYVQHILHYYFEEEDEVVAQAKRAYDEILNKYHEGDYSEDEEEEILNDISTAYQLLISILQNAINKYREEYGYE